MPHNARFLYQQPKIEINNYLIVNWFSLPLQFVKKYLVSHTTTKRKCSSDLMQNVVNICNSLVSKSLPIQRNIYSNYLYFKKGLSTILCKLKTTGTESRFKPRFGFQIYLKTD